MVYRYSPPTTNDKKQKAFTTKSNRRSFIAVEMLKAGIIPQRSIGFFGKKNIKKSHMNGKTVIRANTCVHLA